MILFILRQKYDIYGNKGIVTPVHGDPKKMLQTGLDRLAEDPSCQKLLKGQIGYLCHAASVSNKLQHGLDLLINRFGNRVTSVFGPQHGFTTDRQDNMIESPDILHPLYRIPVFSLYGKTRKPTPEMLDRFDTLVVDLQDAGTRVYTYIWTLFLAMEACAGTGKQVVILDRPNPAGGTSVEGNLPDQDYYSFVCRASIPMRHGMTIGELAGLFRQINNWDLHLEIIPMTGWNRDMTWSDTRLTWINPSPNLSTPESTLIYPGTVLFEGTLLSEGRGTTRSLELFGHPGIEPFSLHTLLNRYLHEQNMKGFILRPLLFTPEFSKYKHRICGGFQIHVTNHYLFKPWYTVLLILKYLYHHSGIRPFWNNDPYEYQFEGLAFDWINGTPGIREWVETPGSTLKDLEQLEQDNSAEFKYLRQSNLLYS
ncbi:MAG: DUF1343 domain-containing protein [Bacteroidales bacterium]|nr:DUF1343 domain-containing protein [Bacteroidales bacterium]